MTWRRFEEYGPPIRVEGGLKARSERGDIGESWWSKRFLTVLESFALGTRLTRGRSYARKGQVLSLEVSPGKVTSTVQGSRPKPYTVTVGLAAFDDRTWRQVEEALAGQAIYSARLLAGEMPAQIEDVFSAAGAPLFPASVKALTMKCTCPDYEVPCKHIAATFYLLAEAFDTDPFQILHWRGREREPLLARLRELRAADAVEPAVARTPASRRRTAKSAPASTPATGVEVAAGTTGGAAGAAGGAAGDASATIGAAVALAEIASPELAETVDRFWVAPVPLPSRPPTLDIDADLLLRQLPVPGAALGGPELVERLRPLYAGLSPADE